MFLKKFLSKISIAYPQNLETKYFLKKLKVKKIKTIGNLKFAEQDNEIMNKLNFNLKVKKFGLHPVLILMRKFFVEKHI